MARSMAKARRLLVSADNKLKKALINNERAKTELSILFEQQQQINSVLNDAYSEYRRIRHCNSHNVLSSAVYAGKYSSKIGSVRRQIKKGTSMRSAQWQAIDSAKGRLSFTDKELRIVQSQYNRRKKNYDNMLNALSMANAQS
jgi:hypothetical protein